MFNAFWFKVFTELGRTNNQPAPIQAAPAPVQTLENSILIQCCTPQTLGEISDRVGLPYRELRPVLHQLVSRRKLKTLFAPVGQINAIHYVATNNYEQQTN